MYSTWRDSDFQEEQSANLSSIWLKTTDDVAQKYGKSHLLISLQQRSYAFTQDVDIYLQININFFQAPLDIVTRNNGDLHEMYL